jgi:hypothetical protein
LGFARKSSTLPVQEPRDTGWEASISTRTAAGSHSQVEYMCSANPL